MSDSPVSPPGGLRRAALYGWLSALVAAVLTAVALIPTAPAVAAAAGSALPGTVSTPFPARGEGYYCFRIPALVTTKSGDLLAFAEGRVATCSDVGHNDIVVKRSTDGGKTWGPLTVVVGKDDTDAHGNPAPVVDAVTGRVSLLYATSTWSGTAGAPVRDTRGVRVVHSVDNGAGWQPSVALPQLKPAGWVWVSTGPGHGIQLTHGAHRGRLVVPGDHTATGNKAGAQLYYSDDGGLTWTLGATSNVDQAVAYPAELTVAETAGGSLYVNARSSARCDTEEHRLDTTSADGGATFAAPFKPVAGLDTSPVFGSLLGLRPAAADGRRERILFSAPARLGPNTLEDRRELAVRSSYDEGRTWQTEGTLVVPGRAGYSDLTLLPSGAVGMLHETAGNIPHGTVAFVSFTESDMDAAKTGLRSPRTADTGPNGNDNHAVVHGGAVLGDRGTGKAMTFDGKDDYLRLVSCSDSLKVKDQDFTVTAWFRHSATTGALPIVWAYGMEDSDPAKNVRQFWLKAEPGKGIMRAAISTDGAYAEVKTNSSYNDGKWHHAIFKREGAKLVLSVDGAAFTANAPAGDITPPGEFSIHVGARPDFPNQPVGVGELFNGGLDDVRIFRRALTAEEAARVKDGALDVANDKESVRLGFSTIG
ncbi:exo-alpha-sialidase [Streptomyces sp. H27-G5]|uniref:sialidase family protein n=1 Tax=Streptomyces sp. H27-G5 TaxID=2996698 RepID=UPI0022707011|nr:sialidase family protein [Streptomyces sp. H27-G5]MCY0923890.1 exo-alpha-sialidase [Streptomyces sp. H27-G5]